MKIVDLLKKESIDLNGIVSDKKETIEKMVFLTAGIVLLKKPLTVQTK